MWLIYAIGAAVFAGITSILAKCGIRDTDSNVATAIRTVVILLFSWLLVFLTGVQGEIASISGKQFLFLMLSGFTTGASWLCYFRALQLGDINKVVPIDKSSTVLTIIIATIFLGEGISVSKVASVVMIGAGIFLMIQKKAIEQSTPELQNKGSRWFIYAALSAVFASLTAILGKIGITGVNSNLGTAIRTCVVLLMAWGIILSEKKVRDIRKIAGRELLFISLSGITTGASWLCYYRALKEGITSVVVAIDKLSVLVTILFSFLVFREVLSKKAAFGLVLLVLGTIALAMVH
ncbi:MAG: EamA family transporter [Lachnospiraceae bacterium]